MHHLVFLVLFEELKYLSLIHYSLPITHQYNLIYFYSPTDLVEIDLNNNQEIRVGGLVADNSLKYEENSSIYRFVITDEKNIINVEYRGILPNLFAENRGVVVEGIYSGANNIIANKVLAKHDENYMPPEVIDALQKEGKWQGE